MAQNYNEQTHKHKNESKKKRILIFFTGDSNNSKALCEMFVGIKGPLQLM